MSPSHEHSILGRCPHCDSEIPAGKLLLSYEPEEGWPRMLAECGFCEEVVGPV